MNNLSIIIAGIAGVIAIPVLRQAIKSYRAKKSVADIVVDSIEAAIDQVEKK
jgi:type II secretory pathway pseudopilin PulG